VPLKALFYTTTCKIGGEGNRGDLLVSLKTICKWAAKKVRNATIEPNGSKENMERGDEGKDP